MVQLLGVNVNYRETSKYSPRSGKSLLNMESRIRSNYSLFITDTFRPQDRINLSICSPR